MLVSGRHGGGTDFRSLYEAHFDMLMKVAYRITNSMEAAEDIVHDAFSKIVERNMDFPTSNDAKFWLIRVVKNNAINYSKRKGREARAYEKWWRSEATPIENIEAGSVTIKETGTEAGVQPSLEEDVVRDEASLELRKALSALSPKLKEVLVLKEFSGMSYKEIGAVLGVSEGNVKVRAFRARAALLKLLGKEDRHVSR
ncbi:MAG: RNA polymerase sigma factor [Spirochaetia bacterium]|nr:RNA polymerase sigma factor [Spirochaetia bacterium]